MYDLKLSENMVNIIGQALMELPFKISAPIIQELQKQVAEQQKILTEVSEDADK